MLLRGLTWGLQDPRSSGSAQKGRLSPALVSQFDMVTCYSSSSSSSIGGGEFEDHLVKHILDLSPGEAASDDQDRASLKRCLEEHLRRAASCAAPKHSKQAVLLLQNYYMVMSCIFDIQHRLCKTVLRTAARHAKQWTELCRSCGTAKRGDSALHIESNGSTAHHRYCIWPGLSQGILK